MTSDEIKNFIDGMEHGDSALFQAEIAFQLAKLNEHFEKVDSYVFGDDRGKSRKARS